jgi:hypothetical protein
MPKLTHSQLVILATAAKRPNHAVLPLSKSLKIKGSALKHAIDALRTKRLIEEQPAIGDAPVWREDEDGRRLALVLTDPGLRAINAEPLRAASSRPPAAPPTSTRRGRRPGHSKPKTRKGANAAPRTGSKQGVLIELLKRKSGASIAEIVEATGWQPHSVRGAISGALKKKLGLPVVSQRFKERGRVYRIGSHG